MRQLLNNKLYIEVRWFAMRSMRSSSSYIKEISFHTRNRMSVVFPSTLVVIN
ncbi:MAG: hypothetical protein ACI8RD_003114 [Bacillariaceae sp.]|jgi:hypothetical protein